MSLDVIVTSSKIEDDPTGRELLQFLTDNQTHLNLAKAVVYYDFPSYVDYDTTLHKPDVVLLSHAHGVVVIDFVRRGLATSIADASEAVEEVSSLLIARLLKSRTLRLNISQLSFSVAPLLLAIDIHAAQHDVTDVCSVITSMAGLEAWLYEKAGPPLTDVQFAEARSVIEGAKALARPQRRNIQRPEVQTAAVSLAALEAEIANFDERQRRTALVTIKGPQRIRGLAGSGKTVILATKAAHLHLTQPDDKILVTFHTRALRNSLKGLITRFYRHWKDEDPDWKFLQIRHGWGGSNTTGVYADACRRASRVALPLAKLREGPEAATRLMSLAAIC